MPTVFRTTATAPDSSGRYRTSLILACRLRGTWSAAAVASHCAAQPLPTAALTVSDAEYDALANGTAPRFGYVNAAGDTSSTFEPFDWHKLRTV